MMIKLTKGSNDMVIVEVDDPKTFYCKFIVLNNNFHALRVQIHLLISVHKLDIDLENDVYWVIGDRIVETGLSKLMKVWNMLFGFTEV